MSLLPTPAALVPHKHDAMLLDEIIFADANQLTARLIVRAGTAFSEASGCLPAWVGPEIMAEAIAALSGYRSLRSSGHAGDVGLLLGIRSYHAATSMFEPGERLEVEVVESSEDEEGRAVFDGKISRAGRVVATGTLTVFQPRDGSFLESECARND